MRIPGRGLDTASANSPSTWSLSAASGTYRTPAGILTIPAEWHHAVVMMGSTKTPSLRGFYFSRGILSSVTAVRGSKPYARSGAQDFECDPFRSESRVFPGVLESGGGPCRTRTGTPLREADFKSAAYTSFAKGPHEARHHICPLERARATRELQPNLSPRARPGVQNREC